MHQIAKYGIDFLSTLFFAGLAGSAIVVLISFVEDFSELFSSDKEEPTAPHTPGN